MNSFQQPRTTRDFRYWKMLVDMNYSDDEIFNHLAQNKNWRSRVIRCNENELYCAECHQPIVLEECLECGQTIYEQQE